MLSARIEIRNEPEEDPQKGERAITPIFKQVHHNHSFLKVASAETRTLSIVPGTCIRPGLPIS